MENKESVIADLIEVRNNIGASNDSEPNIWQAEMTAIDNAVQFLENL